MGLSTEFALTGAVVQILSNGVTVPYRMAESGMPQGYLRLFNGTGVTQADTAIVNAWSIAAATNLDIDLRSGQLDLVGNAVVLSKVKLVICTVTEPGTTDYITLGPQGVTNAAQLGFGGVVSSSYAEVRDMPFVMGGGNFAGWTIDATHKVVRLANPGSNPLTGYLIVVGIT